MPPALAVICLCAAVQDSPADPGRRSPRRPKTPAPEAQPPSFQLTDVEALIGIHSREDLLSRRRALTRLAFGAERVPEGLLPARVDEGITDNRFAGVDGLASIDRLTHVMDHGIESKIYYMKAREPAGSLLIYHHGHHGGFEFAVDAIEAFLDAGHDVLALSMPLEGMNSRPVVTIDRVGTFVLRQHGWIFFLERPLRFFMEPVTAALNHAVGHADYSRIAMAGFSGGGWTATVYAAMDTRILASYPVAGTMPSYLRAELVYRDGTWDREQHWIPMLREANYLEMYVLGASGKGRRQVQILIQGDSQVPQAKFHAPYEEAVAGRVRDLGPGEFRVFVDTRGSRHLLTPGAVSHILADLVAAAP